VNIISLESIKQLVRIKDSMGQILIKDDHYHQRLDVIYRELDTLIMDIVIDELDDSK